MVDSVVDSKDEGGHADKASDQKEQRWDCFAGSLLHFLGIAKDNTDKLFWGDCDGTKEHSKRSSSQTTLRQKRQSLSVEISKRRASLMPGEVSFLESLVEDGNEEELKKAETNLKDSGLIFEPIALPNPNHMGSKRRSTMLERRRSTLHPTTLLEDITLVQKLFGASSSSFNEDDDDVSEVYDPWSNMEQDYDGTRYDFKVLGTHGKDSSAQPHVMTPPLMQAIQPHLPITKQGESFWLKYSMVRDGGCTRTFLKHVRGSKSTILIMETLDGEVFGAYTSHPWHIDNKCFGTSEAFVFRLKHPRSDAPTGTLSEQAKREQDISVYRYSHQNSIVQICNSTRIAVGGGMTNTPHEIEGQTMSPYDWGHAVSFEGDFLIDMTSAPCVTFMSPKLYKSAGGMGTELLNLEAWGLTPCQSEEEANKMECRALFIERPGQISKRNYSH